jgi:hypothetical protein
VEASDRIPRRVRKPTTSIVSHPSVLTTHTPCQGKHGKRRRPGTGVEETKDGERDSQENCKRKTDSHGKQRTTTSLVDPSRKNIYGFLCTGRSQRGRLAKVVRCTIGQGA